jgi:RNA polymerase sigma factor (sigma-70 family)
VVGGDELDAEDVVQETWIRACHHLDRFRWESAFGTWLLGIGLNVARSLLRQRSRQRSHLGTDLPEPPEQVAPPADPDARLDLERAIAGLPDGCRLVLVLHDVEGLKHHEIGTALGIVPGTSKSQLHQARQLLRARLAVQPLKGV